MTTKKPKKSLVKKVKTLFLKGENDESATNSTTLELVPFDEAEDILEVTLPKLEAIEPREPGDLAPFETYIADLTALVQAQQLNINEDLSQKITHYPPSDRLH
jgi:hypothetical protein